MRRSQNDIVQPSDAGAATEDEFKELKHGIEDAVRSAEPQKWMRASSRQRGRPAICRRRGRLEKLDLAPTRPPVRTSSASPPRPREAEIASVLGASLIAINTCLEAGVVVEKVRSLTTGWGLNTATGEDVDTIAAGILDPAKVTRSALAEGRVHRGPVPHHRSSHRGPVPHHRSSHRHPT